MRQPLNHPMRTIMTPGPVEAYPSVLRTMATPILGQFDPAFVAIMNEVKDMIRETFQTTNEEAFVVDGTSRSGIEAALISLISPGDKVLVPAYGRFAYLLIEICERAQADVVIMEKSWDGVFSEEEIIEAVKKHQPKILAMIHGETANGQMQPLSKIGEYCQNNNVFFVVDVVATYSGVEIKVDDWGIDMAIAGTQKCLSVPSGLSLITYSDRVKKEINKRYQKELGLGDNCRNDNPISSNYLDLTQLQRYWNKDRINHHTEATSMIYALHEGLRLYCNEGLRERARRHEIHDRAIIEGIKAMGLELYGDETTKMPTVTPVIIPEGVDGESVRQMMLDDFGVEIASSFGPLAGKVWRIGNMGFSSRKENVLQVLTALEAALIHHNVSINQGAAAQKALNIYHELGI
ncbi:MULTISPECIES: alanine--glyoxylate aminotransferase family protein [Vagococcus]|uniref:pyridoxal-phosphate-dependent aminotransferase family protein n=1 Tax=Vagococcus TaxID=2737 RepID=UPI000E4830C3|nr:MULTISPECIES: alanine--glyoxylate aminotransferase family protein [Vagococcus]RHH71324.1 alanine--glyoxylate aminotransferase family protein [Vagococcus sp. AM17-17]